MKNTATILALTLGLSALNAVGQTNAEPTPPSDTNRPDRGAQRVERDAPPPGRVAPPERMAPRDAGQVPAPLRGMRRDQREDGALPGPPGRFGPGPGRFAREGRDRGFGPPPGVPSRFRDERAVCPCCGRPYARGGPMGQRFGPPPGRDGARGPGFGPPPWAGRRGPREAMRPGARGARFDGPPPRERQDWGGPPPVWGPGPGNRFGGPPWAGRDGGYEELRPDRRGPRFDGPPPRLERDDDGPPAFGAQRGGPPPERSDR
jgi:hypothetical protein